MRASRRYVCDPPVLIGDVEEADPLVERVADDLGESLHAQAGLVAGLSRAHAAGPHPHERDLDAELAQGDLLGRALGKAVLGAARARHGGGGPCGQRGGGRRLRKEFTAIQGGVHAVGLPGV